MKKKKAITKDERKSYNKYKFKIAPFKFVEKIFGAIVVTMLIFAIALLLAKTAKLTETHLIAFIACIIIVLIIEYIISPEFKVKYLKEIYTLDGHIFKTHIFSDEKHHTDGRKTTSLTPKARAISEDGGVTTKWKYYPKKYFKKDNAKVKIIIYKNKAIDFYLVD